MGAWRAWGGHAITVAAVSAVLVGCTVDSRPMSTSSGGYAGTGGAVNPPPAGKSAQPLLVEIDPNRVLTAVGGQGVGVFTEYVAGGHWHVWWTCDTTLTGLPCDFTVTVSVPVGSITNLAGQLVDPSDQLRQPGAQAMNAMTTTTTAIDGVTFDAAPGASITLEAEVNGLSDGSYLFFVQDNQVNGGYEGSLTDPLILAPSSP
jgi:hypothetical protein